MHRGTDSTQPLYLSALAASCAPDVCVCVCVCVTNRDSAPH